YTAAGTYNVKYTLITDVGCRADTIVHPVTLNDPPVAAFNVAAPFCADKPITLTDASTVTGTASINKWIWTFDDGSPAINAITNAAQTHAFATTGNHTISLQVETTSGCQSTITPKQVPIHPNPVVDFNLPNVCLPAGTAQFISSSTIADNTQNQFTYSWDFGDNSPLTGGQSPAHNYTTIGPYNITLSVTSVDGCKTISQPKALTTIYAEPVARFTSAAEVCVGNAASFTDQSNAAGSTVTQWNWNFGDATSSTDQNPVHTYSTAGTYTVTLSVGSAIGCQTVNNIASHTIIVNALPTADFSISAPGCAGRVITFTNMSAANSGTLTQWAWNFGDGSNAILVTSGAPMTHSYLTPGTYPVKLKVESSKGCVSSITSKDLIIHALPVAQFTPPVACVNDQAPFVDASSVTPGSISTWQWNFGDPNAGAGNANTASVPSVTHHYTVPGDYTTQLVSTSNEGCTDTVRHTFTINGGVLTPAFTIENTTALCSNKDIIIKDASQINSGKIIRVEISWDAADLTIKTVDTDPQPGKTYIHTYPEFGSPATKTYTVRYDVYSGLTCVNSKTQSITVLATPVIAFDAVLPICSNSPAFQLGAHLQNTMTGTGAFSGAGVSGSGLFTPSVAGSGSHQITYTFTADNTCVNSFVRTITVDPTPVADAGPDKFLLEGGRVVLSPRVITNIPVTYNWSPPDWLNNPSIPNAEASPHTDFTYTLTVTSDKGCHTSDDVFVKMLKAPIIPNIFSPNGDGIHDKWVIDFLDSYPGCIVQIYNRYGQIIYRVVNYTAPWDGKINGQDAPIGTYYYIIDPKNGRKPITGYVDIIR
ncbi:MAG: PKD domain-containing protein, partial [Chitinophagaceae bacterium]